MALPEFSTLTSVQLRANAKRIKGWTDKDKDSIPDTDTLTAGFQYASGVIFEYLNRRYGETELADWTISTAPPRILAISDDLCIYWFSSSNNSQNDVTQRLYADAIVTLERIRDGSVSLYGVVEDMSDKYAVEKLDAAYEDKEYWNCYTEDTNGGYCTTVTCCD